MEKNEEADLKKPQKEKEVIKKKIAMTHRTQERNDRSCGDVCEGPPSSSLLPSLPPSFCSFDKAALASKTVADSISGGLTR